MTRRDFRFRKNKIIANLHSWDDSIPGDCDLVESAMLCQKFAIFAAFSLMIASPTTVYAAMISGKVSFPSDYIPYDMTICAETPGGRTVKCVMSRNMYRMTLPAGDYFVYAKSSEMKGHKSYYTQSVVCGGGVGGAPKCDSHRPILLRLGDRSVRSNVNPQDWYD